MIGVAIADPGPGLAILWRRRVKPAALGMPALSGACLIGSLIAARDLWADPLAPYGFVRAFCLRVVWMRIRMRNLAVMARDENLPLPQACHRLYRWWFAFGFPAFAAVLAMIWLMLTKPALP